MYDEKEYDSKLDMGKLTDILEYLLKNNTQYKDKGIMWITITRVTCVMCLALCTSCVFV